MIIIKSSSSSILLELLLGRRPGDIAGSGDCLRGSDVNSGSEAIEIVVGVARMVSLVLLRGSASGGLGKYSDCRVDCVIGRCLARKSVVSRQIDQFGNPQGCVW